jgi:CheY-like chemotaxis protein
VRPRRILFVDDSPVARRAATSLLAARGLAVTALASCAEAEGVDASAFSAALLDIELADGLGTDIAERLRQAAPSLPIAFLTAGGPAIALDLARRIGPVFSKSAGVEEAVRWAAEAAPLVGD